MSSSLKTSTKLLHKALGAVVDGSYLYVAADKGIQSEMQGKDNGATIHYKRTRLANATCADAAVTAGGNGLHVTASDYNQYEQDVTIKDSKLMFSIGALDKEITAVGEEVADINIGKKLARAAIDTVLPADMARIGNVFVGDDYLPFNKATAYLKTTTEGGLYGWIDYQAWAKMVSQGQQYVPCALADKRFGKDLMGAWGLIAQLRSIQQKDLTITMGTIGTANVKIAAPSSGVAVLTFTSTASTSIANGESVVFEVAGVNQTNVNGDVTKPYQFYFKNTTGSTIGANGTFTISIPEDDYYLMDIPSGIASTGAAVTQVGTAGKMYAGCIIRGENAQVFGTLANCPVTGAKYEKSYSDGINIHKNTAEDVANMNSNVRYDMFFASKLVEPRDAAMVWIKIN